MNARKRRLEATAKRILGPMSGFRAKADAGTILEKLNRQSQENILGIYENLPGALDDALVITSEGIAWFRGDRGSRYIKYSEIHNFEIPANSKTTAQSILLRLSGGEELLLPVRGGRGRFRDVYEFWRFLRHAIRLKPEN